MINHRYSPENYIHVLECLLVTSQYGVLSFIDCRLVAIRYQKARPISPVLSLVFPVPGSRYILFLSGRIFYPRIFHPCTGYFISDVLSYA